MVWAGVPVCADGEADGEDVVGRDGRADRVFVPPRFARDRAVLRTTRRVAVPLLELLDWQGRAQRLDRPCGVPDDGRSCLRMRFE